MRRSFVPLVTPALAIAGFILAFPMALLHVRYDVAAGRILEAFPTALPGGMTRFALRYEFLAPSPAGDTWYIGHAQRGQELEVPSAQAEAVADRLRDAGAKVFYHRGDPQRSAFIVTRNGSDGWRHRCGVALMGLSLVLWLPLRRISMRNACA